LPDVTQTSNNRQRDLLKVDGYVGNFRVKIRKNPRYVIAERCTGCGECKDACPIEYPNEWDLNLGTTQSHIRALRPGGTANLHINRDYCIECFKCVDACGEREAINFDQQPEEMDIEVGAIIVSTGFETYCPTICRFWATANTPTCSPPWSSSG
jgi:heterodisulfide reductase subunit A2